MRQLPDVKFRREREGEEAARLLVEREPSRRVGEQADPWPATNAARHGSREQEVRRVRDEAAQHSAPGARSASHLQGEENDLDLEIIDSRPVNRMETAPLLVKGGEDWGCEALGNKTARQVRNVLLRYKDEFRTGWRSAGSTYQRPQLC